MLSVVQWQTSQSLFEINIFSNDKNVSFHCALSCICLKQKKAILNHSILSLTLSISPGFLYLLIEPNCKRQELTLMFLPPSMTEFICSRASWAASGTSYSTNAKPCEKLGRWARRMCFIWMGINVQYFLVHGLPSADKTQYNHFKFSNSTVVTNSSYASLNLKPFKYVFADAWIHYCSYSEFTSSFSHHIAPLIWQWGSQKWLQLLKYIFYGCIHLLKNEVHWVVYKIGRASCRERV